MNKFVISIDGTRKSVQIIDEETAEIDGKTVSYELKPLNCQDYLLRIDNIFYEISSEKIDKQKYSLVVQGKRYETAARTELEERAKKLIDEAQAGSSQQTEVKAPMPGMILKIAKQAGDEIVKGDSVLILEAMKMENDLKSPASGTIKSINVKEGSAVEKGTILFSIA